MRATSRSPAWPTRAGRRSRSTASSYLSANITPDPSGISYYDEALFIRAMRTGNVGGRRLAPIMPWSEIRKLTDGDLKALWAYLKTVSPVAHDVERAAVDLKDDPAFDDRTATASAQ